MGTNDGSRNFSANCDLERSMSTQTNVLALAGGSNVAIKAQASGGWRGTPGTRTGSIPPEALSFGPLSAPTHTQGGKEN